MNFKTVLGAAAFALAMPVSAYAVTFGGDLDNQEFANLSIGDVFEMEIDGDAVDGASADLPFDVYYEFTATEDLYALETNSLNPTNGFLGTMVEWNSSSDGSGTSFGSISGADLIAGDTLRVEFAAGETKFLIASWTDVARNGSNFDLRVEATPVPVPAGILLMGTALAGFGVMRRKAKKAS